MAHLVNAMSTVATHSVISFEEYYKQKLTSEENEDKYLRGCSHECRVHPRNRYVSENDLSQEEVVERLAAIGEGLDVTPA